MILASILSGIIGAGLGAVAGWRFAGRQERNLQARVRRCVETMVALHGADAIRQWEIYGCHQFGDCQRTSVLFHEVVLALAQRAQMDRLLAEENAR